MKVYVLTATSESGDHFGPWVFNKKPSEQNIETFLRAECEQEFEDGPGPGIFGSYLHIDGPNEADVIVIK